MIVFNNVSKQFSDGSTGLQDITFSVDPGELVLITGPSGAGKTTLMRLLTKEYDPSQGEILFDDQPLHQVKPSQLHHHRRQIGVIFQDYKLLPDLNVWENVALALDILGMKNHEIEERITDLLELVGLTDKAYLFPVQLSGGEAQRVSIARALAPAPKVIFADEPTGNLDPETSQTIAQLFEKINELGTTLLMATHDQQIIDKLNARLIRLNQGQLETDTGSEKTTSKKTSGNAEKNTSAPEKPQPAEPTKPGQKIKIATTSSNRISKWFSQVFSFAAKSPPTAESKPEPTTSESSEKADQKEKSTQKTSKPDKTETTQLSKTHDSDQVKVKVESI